MSLLQRLGTTVYWLAWPAFRIYFCLNDRARVVLVCDNKVLGVKQWLSDGTWSLPGGGLHNGEKPITGALREVREETGIGLNAKDLTYLGKAKYQKAGLHFNYHIYAMKAPKSLELNRQRHEVAELQWMPASDFTVRNASPDALHSLELARQHHILLQ